MHMTSRKDLNSAELETVTTSRCPTTVITANGEVQTHEEATVYVKGLNVFLTVKILEDTPAVLSLGKHCVEIGQKYPKAQVDEKGYIHQRRLGVSQRHPYQIQRRDDGPGQLQWAGEGETRRHADPMDAGGIKVGQVPPTL